MFITNLNKILSTREAESANDFVDVVYVQGGELCLKGPHAGGVREHLAQDVRLDALGGELQRDDGGVLLVEGAGLLGEGRQRCWMSTKNNILSESVFLTSCL